MATLYAMLLSYTSQTFAMDHFYNVMSAIPSLIYFQLSGISMLEINSEMLSKSFISFPVSTCSKHASEYRYS